MQRIILAVVCVALQTGTPASAAYWATVFTCNDRWVWSDPSEDAPFHCDGEDLEERRMPTFFTTYQPFPKGWVPYTIKVEVLERDLGFARRDPDVQAQPMILKARYRRIRAGRKGAWIDITARNPKSIF